jgi:hypothetical protein
MRIDWRSAYRGPAKAGVVCKEGGIVRVGTYSRLRYDHSELTGRAYRP